MLVLSRKTNETIQIGDDVKITVVRVQGNKVRIGIEAPMDLAIVRGELLFDDSTEIEIDPTPGSCRLQSPSSQVA